MQKTFKIFLNILLTLIIISIVGILGYLAYDYITYYFMSKEAAETVDLFEEQTAIVVDITDNENQTIENTTTENPSNNNKAPTVTKHKGYTVIGSIQIPKTKVKIPIVDKVTPNSIVAAAALLYGPGLNESGNNVLVAHNYRNGTFFSNNKKLALGDKIYISDANGRKIEYEVTNTYITTDSDFSYATRNTNGKREISLSTCTTDASKRLVIWAREV